MRLLFPATTALAALAFASTALAGPGCGGGGHDATASTEMSPTPDASTALAEASEGVAESPAHWAEVLAYLGATVPETTLR